MNDGVWFAFGRKRLRRQTLNFIQYLQKNANTIHKMYFI